MGLLVEVDGGLNGENVKAEGAPSLLVRVASVMKLIPRQLPPMNYPHRPNSPRDSYGFKSWASSPSWTASSGIAKSMKRSHVSSSVAHVSRMSQYSETLSCLAPPRRIEAESDHNSYQMTRGYLWAAVEIQVEHSRGLGGVPKLLHHISE